MQWEGSRAPLGAKIATRQCSLDRHGHCRPHEGLSRLGADDPGPGRCGGGPRCRPARHPGQPAGRGEEAGLGRGWHPLRAGLRQPLGRHPRTDGRRANGLAQRGDRRRARPAKQPRLAASGEERKEPPGGPKRDFKSSKRGPGPGRGWQGSRPFGMPSSLGPGGLKKRIVRIMRKRGNKLLINCIHESAARP